MLDARAFQVIAEAGAAVGEAEVRLVCRPVQDCWEAFPALVSIASREGAAQWQSGSVPIEANASSGFFDEDGSFYYIQNFPHSEDESGSQDDFFSEGMMQVLDKALRMLYKQYVHSSSPFCAIRVKHP